MAVAIVLISQTPAVANQRHDHNDAKACYCERNGHLVPGGSDGHQADQQVVEHPDNLSRAVLTTEVTVARA